jgi:predicted alpha/beta-fold hydrolase
MTKLLGELGDDARDLGICGGAVACVPMNALQCQPQLDTNSFNRKVYSGNFLKSLKPKAELQHTRFPDRFDIERVRAASTLGDFDEAFIAPVYGFKDKEVGRLGGRASYGCNPCSPTARARCGHVARFLRQC